MTDQDRARSRAFAMLMAGLQITLGACGRDFSPTNPPSDSLRAERNAVLPDGWFRGGTSWASYAVGLDYAHPRTGSAAAFLASYSAFTAPPPAFVTLMQGIRADRYRGHRVRWSGWARTVNVTGEGAGLWMRVDGPGVVQAFDNMESRLIVGTGDWSHVSVVLDVAPDAIGLSFGALLVGPGDLVVDDFLLEVVGTEVPTTNQITGPLITGSDSAATAAAYEGMPLAPENLDFERLVAAAAQPPRSR